MHISEGTQNTNLKEHKHPYVYCSVIYNRRDMEAAQVSISRSVDKTTMGHLHNEILLSHKIEEKFALAGVAQWIECWPVSQRVASPIPSQGTCLGCGPGPQ